jgi:manganese/zinc/iron transport system substrate-binding protein
MRQFCIIILMGLLALVIASFLWFLNNFFESKRVIQKKDQLLIVTTTGMIYSLVKSIVGQDAEVYSLMGPGIDPHTFRARPSDLMQLDAADFVFYNGLHLEGKMVDFLQGGRFHNKVYALGLYIDTKRLIKVGPDIYDPHIWHDVSLWLSLIDPIVEIISNKINREKRSNLLVRANAYKKKLIFLHDYLIDTYSHIPAEKRILITAHDAFSYFARAYGFKVVALQGVSTETEAGIADINSVADYILQHNIPVIFTESCISPKGIKVIAEKVSLAGQSVRIGGTLFADAPGTDGVDAYEKMICQNMKTVIMGFGLLEKIIIFEG